MDYKLMLTLLLMAQCFLLACGVYQVINGNLIIGTFNIVANIAFGILNIISLLK